MLTLIIVSEKNRLEIVMRIPDVSLPPVGELDKSPTLYIAPSQQWLKYTGRSDCYGEFEMVGERILKDMYCATFHPRDFIRGARHENPDVYIVFNNQGRIIRGPQKRFQHLIIPAHAGHRELINILKELREWKGFDWIDRLGLFKTSSQKVPKQWLS